MKIVDLAVVPSSLGGNSSSLQVFDIEQALSRCGRAGHFGRLDCHHHFHDHSGLYPFRLSF